MKYLIKYSAEIGTKSNNVKPKFQKRLANNILDALVNKLPEHHFRECELQYTFNHIELNTPVEVDSILRWVAGVQYFTQVQEVNFHNHDQLAEDAVNFFRDKVALNKTFAVRCKKSVNEKVSGRAIESKVGAKLDAYGRVKLDNPGITCFVEIRKNKAYLYDTKIPGPGGLPIGQQGRTLTLFSGGIDSPVAAWMIYNTGMDQDFLFFDLGSEEQKENAIQTFKYLRQHLGHGATSRFIVLDFLPVIREIMNVPGPYQNLVLKYYFYRAAEKVAHILKSPALATGEAIGQVSTQTLQNLTILDNITPLLVIRPLSNLHKDNISQKAKEIGTFDIAYRGKEFCALATKNVVTNARYKHLIREVKKLDHSLIDEAVASRKIYNMDQGKMYLEESRGGSGHYKERGGNQKPGLNSADKVIDLRPAHVFKEYGLPGSENMDFHHALQDFYHWDKSQSYFIVCEVGNNSRILSAYMEEEGFNVAHLPGGLKNYDPRQQTLENA